VLLVVFDDSVGNLGLVRQESHQACKIPVLIIRKGTSVNIIGRESSRVNGLNGIQLENGH